MWLQIARTHALLGHADSTRVILREVARRASPNEKTYAFQAKVFAVRALLRRLKLVA